MKNTILSCAALLCILASCKKSSSGSNYHVTATVDGTSQTFNVSPLAIQIQNGGLTMITIEGFSTNTSTTSTMALSWNNNVTTQKFGPATYADTAQNYSTMGVYAVSVGQSFVSGSGIEMLAAGTGTTIANHLKLVITSVDSTHIKGTFSGDFYQNSDISGAIKKVTNGDFDVPWKK